MAGTLLVAFAALLIALVGGVMLGPDDRRGDWS